MGYVVAGLVLVALMAGVNLVLTIGLIGRFREQQHAHPHTESAPPAIGVVTGSAMPAFAATALDGDPISRAAVLGDQVLIGFFSPDCGGCTESIPAFTDRIQTMGSAGVRSIAVVVGSGAAESAMVAQLAGIAGTVIAEDNGGPVGAAFGVSFYPVFVEFDRSGTATHAGIGASALQRHEVTA